MKTKIKYTVELYLDDVALTVWTNKKFQGEDRNFGFISVGGSVDPDKTCNWDSLDFFMDVTNKAFRDECGKELEEKGFEVHETRRAIRRLINRAKKQNLLR